jgi:outer membrane protein, multidrug efflux system
MRPSPIILLVAIACGVDACKVGPNFTAPHETVPDNYSGISQTPQTPGPKVSSEPSVESFWWAQFHDSDLDRLEERAAADNLDLKAAYLRLVEARLQVQSARAQGLPSLNGAASYTREQLGLAGIVKSKGLADGTTSPATQSLIHSLEQPVNIYQLGFDASWELDLFGKVGRSVEAAEAQSTGAAELSNDLRISVQAEVAQTYLELRTAQSLRQLTLDLISAQNDVADLTLSRQQHGLASESDSAAAQAQLSTLRSQLPPYEQTIAAAKHALAILCGQTPEALDADFASPVELPALPASVPVGVPSTLARRRPDIRASEAALHAATAEVGVAVASMFPDISLKGTLGLRNVSTRYLFDWDSKFYTFGPNISVPIFQGGALVSNVRLSRARAAEATLNYRKTVLTALGEVEDGLTSLQEGARRTASIRDALTANQRALELSLASYRHGLVSYIAVLTLQLQVMQTRQQFVQAQLTQSVDLIKLYKALGGAWSDSGNPM